MNIRHTYRERLEEGGERDLERGEVAREAEEALEAEGTREVEGNVLRGRGYPKRQSYLTSEGEGISRGRGF